MSSEIKTFAESRYTSDEGGNEEEKELLILHPAGQIAFKQTKIPLNVAIEKIGSRNVVGDNEFSLAFDNNGALDSKSLEENFAPAEFFDLNNDQKLSRPSFEKYDSGLELDQDFLSFSDDIEMELEYEEEVMDVSFDNNTNTLVDLPSSKKYVKINTKIFNYFKSNNKLHALKSNPDGFLTKEIVDDIKIVENEVAIVYDGKITGQLSTISYTKAYQEKEKNLMNGKNENFEIISNYEMFT